MGHEKNRLIQYPLEAQELILHLPPDQWIKGREWLIQEPDIRLHRQRPGDADALLLAAGELSWEVVLPPA